MINFNYICKIIQSKGQFMNNSLEKKLFESVENKTPDYIKQNKHLINLYNK